MDVADATGLYFKVGMLCIRRIHGANVSHGIIGTKGLGIRGFTAKVAAPEVRGILWSNT